MSPLTVNINPLFAKFKAKNITPSFPSSLASEHATPLPHELPLSSPFCTSPFSSLSSSFGKLSSDDSPPHTVTYPEANSFKLNWSVSPSPVNTEPSTTSFDIWPPFATHENLKATSDSTYFAMFTIESCYKVPPSAISVWKLSQKSLVIKALGKPSIIVAIIQL